MDTKYKSKLLQQTQTLGFPEETSDKSLTALINQILPKNKKKSLKYRISYFRMLQSEVQKNYFFLQFNFFK